MLTGTDRRKELSIFSPTSVAKSLKREETPSRKEPSNKDSGSGSSTSATIDTSVLAEKLFEVGINFFARRQRKQEKRDAQLDQGVLRLAKQLNGFLGLPDLLGFKVCNEAEGQASLQRLARQGHCTHLCDYKDEAVYVFSEFLQRVWVCEYCDSHFEIHEHDGETCSCSNCSAPMERGIL